MIILYGIKYLLLANTFYWKINKDANKTASAQLAEANNAYGPRSGCLLRPPPLRLIINKSAEQ